MSTLVSSLDHELKNMNDAYFNYINEHIENVKNAYYKIKNILIRKNTSLNNESLISTLEYLDKIIQFHDSSKYEDAEFDAYRRKFYPTSLEKKDNENEDIMKEVDENFELAWQHHYKNNNHHPKHWVDIEDGKPISDMKKHDMDFSCIIEMICDWEAMSMKFHGNTIDWFLHKSKDERECMTTNTLKNTEYLLRIIYDFNEDFNYEDQ